MTENAPEEPDALYYFCALNSDERKQWFREIIQVCRVYFRHRDQLNDLNELRPEIVFDGSNKEIRDFVRNLIISKSPVKLSPAQRLIEENRLIHRYKNSSRGVEEMLHEILDKIGVFSLTETISEQLLWTHYADAHRGVAIEFDPQSGLFTNAQKVVYTNELPVINRLRDGSDVILEKSMFTKANNWAHEREWRVIARWYDEVRIEQYLQQHNVPQASESFIRDQHGPGHYTIPPDAIRSITLGARISSDVESWVQRIVENSPNKPTIRRAVQGRDRTLTFV